jgi:hypothetical protein
MNYLTYKNHGDLGFADAINRIDILTRLANKHNLMFAMPDLSTVIHGNDYLHEFGLDQYQYSAASLAIIQTVEISLDNFLNGFEFDSYRQCLFIVKNFDYNLAGKLSRAVTEFESFPFKQFFNPRENPESDLDFVLHLRMGDRYIYQVGDRFVCPWKYVYSNADYAINTALKLQWSLDKLKRVIEHFEACGARYRLFSDGIGSAVKTIRNYHGWSNVADSDIETIISTLEHFESEFLDAFSGCNLSYAGSRISDIATAVVSAKNIIITEGGLASSLNKFYNDGLSDVQSFHDLYCTLVD